MVWSGIGQHLLDAQGSPAKADGLITQLPRVGDAELIGPGHAAKFRHSAVFVEPDAIGPCLAVVDFDAVCHGNGMRRDWINCREAPAGWWSRICLPPCITRTPPLAAMPHDSFAAILARPWLCGPVGIGSAEWPAPKWGNCRPAMIFGSFVVKRLGFFFVSKKPNGLLLFDGINGLGSGGGHGRRLNSGDGLLPG